MSRHIVPHRDIIGGSIRILLRTKASPIFHYAKYLGFLNTDLATILRHPISDMSYICEKVEVGYQGGRRFGSWFCGSPRCWCLMLAAVRLLDSALAIVLWLHLVPPLPIPASFGQDSSPWWRFWRPLVASFKNTRHFALHAPPHHLLREIHLIFKSTFATISIDVRRSTVYNKFHRSLDKKKWEDKQNCSC